MESQPHAVLFPFMAKGHMIPFLRFARLLHTHRPNMITITIFTTPANKTFITESLSDLPSNTISIIILPFSPNVPEIPPGVESTDKLPSISLFLPFANATKVMQSNFEDELQRLNNTPVTFILSDSFLHWTQESASKFNIPRIAFYGLNSYLGAVIGPHITVPELDHELIRVPDFPWIKVCRIDLDDPFNRRDPRGPHFDFIMEAHRTTAKSHGVVVNSFYELEPLFSDYCNEKRVPKSWPIGPFCLAEFDKKISVQQNSTWLPWLNEKLAEGETVLYIAFGSQVDFSMEQLRDIALGLEKSKVNFLWVVRKNQELIDGFEERVKERGLVVREWVDQSVILQHQSVKGFLSHCGWNSVTESICAKVPILAWPIMGDQPINAKMVVEEIKIGLRVQTSDGKLRGFVHWEELEKKVRELMEGDIGKQARKKVQGYGNAAKKAMDEGGSSWRNLELLLEELCTIRIRAEEKYNAS